jgi:thymidylate kinase
MKRDLMDSAPGQRKALPMVAIIGIDGSGKSTVLSALRQNFRHPFVQDVYILQRRSRKRAEGKLILNYEKSPRSRPFSIVKLLYQALSWTIRYHFGLFPRMRAGVLILCDHFSFLGTALDPRKSRYGGPHRLVSWVLRIIPRPDVYIFLDAPAEVIYGRKQEITRDEMERLILRYRKAMVKMNNVYVVNAASSLEQVTASVSEILNRVLEQS